LLGEGRPRVAAPRACWYFGLIAGIAVSPAPRPASAQATAAARAAPDPLELPPVEVVGVTPVLGTGVPIDQVPSNVQTLTAPQLENESEFARPLRARRLG
jgi:hypothetical protein